MAYFDKISIDGTSYDVRDSSTASLLTQETTQREQADEHLSGEIASISSEFNSLPVRNYNSCVFIGDSYIGLTPSWADQLAGLLPGLVTYHKFPNGGGGYQTSGVSGTFSQMLSAGGSVYTAVQSYKNDVSFVIIEGGINDGETNTNDQSSAVQSAVNAAKTLFPNARILLVYNWFSHAYPEGQWRGILHGGTLSGAEVCVDSRVWLWSANPSDYFQSDNTHPNAAGTNLAVKMLYRWLMTGKAEWSLPLQLANLSTGMSVYFEVGLQTTSIYMYGTVNTPVNTTNLGTMPLCLRPYQRTIQFPCVTNMTNSEIATRGPNVFQWGSTGVISTNGNPQSAAINTSTNITMSTDYLFMFTG